MRLVYRGMNEEQIKIYEEKRLQHYKDSYKKCEKCGGDVEFVSIEDEVINEYEDYIFDHQRIESKVTHKCLKCNDEHCLIYMGVYT